MELTRYSLSLADGRRWLIHAGDPEAARIVPQLGSAMELPTGGGSSRDLVAVVNSHRPSRPILSNGRGPVFCVLDPPVNGDMLTIQAMRLSLAIARDAQCRGGLLLHGALAAWPGPHDPGRGRGCGVIMAGPGTVGKTTASRRLALPWRSMCDDATLVVRDPRGRYWAHPWPTWGRFYDNGPGGTWPVREAVPLQAVFFLSQSHEDSAAPLNNAQTTALLMESVQQVCGPMTRGLSEAEVQALHEEQLAAAAALAAVIPAWRLHLSLDGTFWKEMETVLSAVPARPFPDRVPSSSPSPVDIPDDSPLPVLYTGPSMNPTLEEPDLLEVVPYAGKRVRKGDVIYFQPPEGDRPVVHRVTRVTGEGVRTRGDNNREKDPYLLPYSAIMGRVTAARGSGGRRRIAGGRRGQVQYHLARMESAVLRLSQILLHRLYHGLAQSGFFRGILPAALKPRLVVFEARGGKRLKVLMGKHAVAHYDMRNKEWHIRRPFRLFVDEAALPRPEAELPPGTPTPSSPPCP